MPLTPTEEHRRAAARRRRIVVNFDVTFAINVCHRKNLREVAERWPFDGIELDYARSGVCFPAGTAWLRRDCMTGFVREMREMLLRIGKGRGRPMLLAARVPENLAGCRFDGLDVETWAREELVDLLVPGVRSLEVDLVDFRRICRGTQIRLYPSIDDHHASDGYQNPGIELFRGLASTWRRDGADGLHNSTSTSAPMRPTPGQDWVYTKESFFILLRVNGNGYEQMSGRGKTS